MEVKMTKYLKKKVCFSMCYVASQLPTLYDEYGLQLRVRSGLGMGRVTSNRVENENKHLQDAIGDVRDKGLHEIIPAVQDYCKGFFLFSEHRSGKMERFASAIVSDGGGDWTLARGDLAVTNSQWFKMKNGQRTQLLQKIGLHDVLSVESPLVVGRETLPVGDKFR